MRGVLAAECNTTAGAKSIKQASRQAKLVNGIEVSVLADNGITNLTANYRFS
jgi:hypothetical protein